MVVLRPPRNREGTRECYESRGAGAAAEKNLGGRPAVVAAQESLTRAVQRRSAAANNCPYVGSWPIHIRRARLVAAVRKETRVATSRRAERGSEKASNPISSTRALAPRGTQL